MMDFSDIAPVDTAMLEIMQPGTSTGTGWKIDLAGPGHDKTVAWSTEQARKVIERTARLEAQQLNGRKIKPEEKDVAATRRDNVAWVVARIIGWTPVKIGFISPEPIPYSEQNAFDVLMHPRMGFVLNQIIEFLADERSFTPPSAKV